MLNQVVKPRLSMVTYSVVSADIMALLVHLSLRVNAISKKINGVGSVINKKVIPSVDVDSVLMGHLIYETVMAPGVSKIQVVLTGYPNVHPINNVQPDLEILLVLAEDWQSGKATYKYLNGDKWIQGEGVIEKAPTVTI